MVSSIVDLKNPTNWPPDLLAVLSADCALYMDWETRPGHVSAGSYDNAINRLSEHLKAYSLVGWHCTRLTGDEIADIRAHGIMLPDLAMLSRRIDTLAAKGLLSPIIAARLKIQNQARDRNRAGMFWLCFFYPALAGEGGIGRFFRHWGGEALYNSHEDDPFTSPVLRSIGTPCVIEAEVPISAFRSVTGLALKVVCTFLVGRGLLTKECLNHEGCIVQNLSAGMVRKIALHPSPEFSKLTGFSRCKTAL